MARVEGIYFGNPLGSSYHGENVAYSRFLYQLPENLTENRGHRQLPDGRVGDLGMEVDGDDLGQPGQGSCLVGGTIEAYMRWRKVGEVHVNDNENYFVRALIVSYLLQAYGLHR